MQPGVERRMSMRAERNVEGRGPEYRPGTCGLDASDWPRARRTSSHGAPINLARESAAKALPNIPPPSINESHAGQV